MRKMAKRSKRGLSKKWLPKNSVRIMGTEGTRVWKWEGREYPTMRSLIFRGNPIPAVEPEVETSTEIKE
jgi:hypothetical protein